MRREAVDQYFSTRGPAGRPHRPSNTLYPRIFYCGCYLGECYVFLFCCVTRASLISHRTTPVREGSRIPSPLRGNEAQSATHVTEVNARRLMPPGHRDRRTASTPAKAAATAKNMAK